MNIQQHANNLVNVRHAIDTIEIELKYATAENFVQQVVYDFKNCYLLQVVVDKLELAQKELNTIRSTFFVLMDQVIMFLF